MIFLNLFNKIDSDNGEIRGIFKQQDALEVKEMSEKFLKVGIRTERFLAIIELKEIIDEEGEKLLIEVVKKSRFFMPVTSVIAVRAFGTKNRISEARESGSSKLEDAKKMVSQELSVANEDFSFDDYLEWFAEILSKNIGLMHKNYWAHICITSHNITLDYRIVDLDK